VFQFLSGIFSDGDGVYSSKRTITLCAFVLMATAFVGDIIWDIKVADFMFNGLLYIVLAGLGFTTIEPLSKVMGSKSKGSSGADDS
jgi:hypothetical protein